MRISTALLSVLLLAAPLLAGEFYAYCHRMLKEATNKKTGKGLGRSGYCLLHLHENQNNAKWTAADVFGSVDTRPFGHEENPWTLRLRGENPGVHGPRERRTTPRRTTRLPLRRPTLKSPDRGPVSVAPRRSAEQKPVRRE